MQQPQTKVFNVVYNSGHNHVKGIQQLQAKQVPTMEVTSASTTLTTTLMSQNENANQSVPSDPTPPHPFLSLQHNQQGPATTVSSLNNSKWNTARSSTVQATTPTATTTGLNNQESSSTLTSVSSSSLPQHIRPSTANIVRNAYSTNSSSDIPPALPISVMALAPNTPNLQPTSVVSQHLPLARNSETTQQKQQLQKSQKQMNPPVTKYASVPTQKLATKSVISLSPSFLQSLSNQRIQSAGKTSVPTSPGTPSTTQKTCRSGSNEKKRSSPDPDSQQAKKVSKVSGNNTKSAPVSSTEKPPAPPSNVSLSAFTHISQLSRDVSLSLLSMLYFLCQYYLIQYFSCCIYEL